MKSTILLLFFGETTELILRQPCLLLSFLDTLGKGDLGLRLLFQCLRELILSKTTLLLKLFFAIP